MKEERWRIEAGNERRRNDGINRELVALSSKDEISVFARHFLLAVTVAGRCITAETVLAARDITICGD